MKMKRKVMMTPTVREIITIFLLVKIIGVAGQTTCNNGLGRVLYERLPNQQLQGFDDDVVRDSAAPFRVLEKCQDLCLRDRTATNNLVRACTSFDFQPGSRIAAFSGGAEYEESTCYLTREQAAPEGIGNLMLVPNSVHFTEVCLTSSRPERECPSRRYVFERHPRKKLKLPISDIKEMTAANRSDCEDKCLSEFSFVCRSANYDSTQRTCTMTRYTRRTHPELLEDDPNSDYLENTCLNAERRCDGLAVFIKEENKRLGGPFEVDIFNNMTLEECQTMCLRAEKYFCRSVEFDDQTKQCILSEEDSVSQKDDISISSSPSHHFYDLVCLDNPRASEYPDNSVTSHLFSSGRRPDTAFQRYRNSRLGGEFHSEITGRSLSECLDECLRQTSFQCRSAVYSDRFRTCRLSRYNQRDGMRIIYDADYDYYENLMLGGDGVGGDGRPDSRPDNSDWRPGDRDRDRDRDPNRYPTDPNRYPPYDRYPSMRPGDDRYPGMDKYPGDDRYPNDRRPGMDRYPGGMDRYPGGMDRYPDMERYPGDFDRHPGGMDRYPGGMDRYPGGMDRYPGGMDRYPGGTDRYPGGADRYPGGADRYPGGADRYPGGMDRYPYERYPPMDRYPPIPDNHLPDDRRYPGRDRDRYPSRDRDRDRDRYPFPERTPPGRYSPVDKEYYPGDRYMPGGSRYPPSGSRYPMIPDDRYPMSGRYPQGRYPDVAGGRLKPDRIPPVSDNRFPVGNDRNPTFIYKYGNRERFPSGTGYDRFPPPYFDRTFPDRGYMDRGYLDRGHSYYGSREFGVGERYPMERPGLGRPPYGPPGEQQPFRPPMGSGYDNSLGPYGGDGFGGYGPQRPYFSKCDDNDGFRQTASRHRLRRQYVKKSLAAPTLIACQRECSEIREFMCRSFNYRDPAMGYEADRDRTAVPNCELSDRDTRDLDLQNPSMFDAGNFDFYERSMSRSGDGDCLDVSQTCNEDGMEFTLRTPEGFQGRIYTYGFYDRCFFRGNGGTVNVLRITGQQGYPECGTQRNGDSMTNIVVVQFSDHVQTGKDKRFNLTCIFRGPGEAVVTSGYIGAGSGSPIPIEYLPAENTLSSKVRLMILYQGRPTTTIAVGDPLTFRLEAQDGYNQISDIFATNVIARDPYSGRSIQLIDRYGCPVDPFVFPELDKSRDGDTLEARFNAFKIPESNFLVFEATVRSCRDGCQPAYCPTGQSGRSEPSFGKRRRRSINDTAEAIREDRIILPQENVTLFSTLLKSNLKASNATTEVPEKSSDPEEMPEHVHEMIEVFDSRDEIDQGAVARKLVSPIETVCMSPTEYHGLLTALVLLILLLLVVSLVSGLAYRKYWIVVRKNVTVDRSSVNSYNNSTFRQNISTSQFDASGRSGTPHSIRPGLSLFSGNLNKTFATGNLARMCQLPVINPIRTSGNETEFDDPSEPIYTDPSLFERSRSLGSVAMEDLLEEQSDSQKTKN